MNEKTTYNGWTNYETWNVALWMDNDQGSQEYWLERAKECLDDAETNSSFTKEENAAFALEDALKDYFEEQNPIGTNSDMYADLLNAALREVNWYEIAENYIKDVKDQE